MSAWPYRFCVNCEPHVYDAVTGVKGKLAAKDARIVELERDLSIALGASDALTFWREKAEALEAEVERLRRLEPYAQHRSGCRSTWPAAKDPTAYNYAQCTCDCGLDAARGVK